MSSVKLEDTPVASVSVMTQKGLISSDMLDDIQVEQYLNWAKDLDITYTIDIKKGVVCED